MQIVSQQEGIKGPATMANLVWMTSDCGSASVYSQIFESATGS